MYYGISLNFTNGEEQKSGHSAQENPNNLQTNWADRKRFRQGTPTMQPMTNHTLLQTQRRNHESLIPISLCFHQAHSKTVPSFSFVVIHRRWASNYQLLPQLKQQRICSVPSVCFGVKNFATWWNWFFGYQVDPDVYMSHNTSNYIFTSYFPHDPASCSHNCYLVIFYSHLKRFLKSTFTG